MKTITGAAINPKIALKEYIDISTEFLGFLRDGVKIGVLGNTADSPDGPFGNHRKWVKVLGGANWEVHVAPEEIAPAKKEIENLAPREWALFGRWIYGSDELREAAQYPILYG